MFMGGCSEFYRQRRDLNKETADVTVFTYIFGYVTTTVVNSPQQSRSSLSNAIYYTSTAKNMVYNGGE